MRAVILGVTLLGAAVPALAVDLGAPVEPPAPGRLLPYAGEFYGGPAMGEPGRPSSRSTRSSDYAGSDRGLGKPSFWGLAPRPDWGRSSLD